MVTDRQAAPAEPTTAAVDADFRHVYIVGKGRCKCGKEFIGEWKGYAFHLEDVLVQVAIEAEARQPSPGLREALKRLTEAARIIVINDVPSDEAWKDFEAAYDDGLAALVASAEPASERATLALEQARLYGASPATIERLEREAHPPVAGPAGEPCTAANCWRQRRLAAHADHIREGWFDPVTGDGYAPDQARPPVAGPDAGEREATFVIARILDRMRVAYGESSEWHNMVRIIESGRTADPEAGR